MNDEVKNETNDPSSTQKEIAQESKNIAILIWIGTIFFGFIPGLIFYLAKKDDAYVCDQGKEALNWSITALIGYAISMVLMFVVIGIFTMFLLGITHIVFCIMGAIATSNGKPFRVPYAIRLIK